MSNINMLTKRKQLATLIGVLIAGSVGAGVVYLTAGDSKPAAQAIKPQSTPVSGVVTNAFTEQVQKSVLQQQQERTAVLEKQLEDLKKQVTNQPSGESADVLVLKATVDALLKNQKASAEQNNGAHAVGQPEVKWNVQGSNSYPNPPVFPAGQGGNNYVPPKNDPRPQIGGIQHTSFSWEHPKVKGNTLPWISSGSFINASMIEGADANASVTGQQSSTPVVFTLLGNASLPNGHKYNLDQCRVTGEIYGDISSERGEVRTDHISCNLSGDRHVDMPFKGHVSYQGKEGIRGKPVMRNGKIIAYAGAAGVLSGLGSGISESGTTSVGIGATATPAAGEIARQAFGGGASKAADTLSQYWIKRAEQYHPVIDIGAGNAVTVVFQEGFQLTTIEDEIARKSESAAGQVVDKVADNISADDGARTLSSLPPSGQQHGTIINPDDVIRKAKDLDLGSTVTGQ
ncbi:F-type conjugal transfer pilus assembly protein TraB [Erwinia amylovora]|uniref:F-type conjugal transfer pilus assembly protein TraB n=1 Tax=Erwinia amylovora TaxID=552 RepID=UPI0020C0E83F|nr:F-type conjugal transfer pilus assembly protein TraB [Erwinia amylovora]MCK8417594.1 F-type conjugal transfer pilus assembly protein TraB [Erwinia amylovora]